MEPVRTIGRREALTSAALHGGAAALSAVGLIVLLHRLPPQMATLAVLGVTVYCASLVAAFLSSALYHGAREGERAGVLAALDHCAIYVLIAGTYTPFGLISLAGHDGVVLVGIEWLLALVGIAIRLFWLRRLHGLSIPLYLLMGWLGVFWARSLLQTIGVGGIALLVAGGLAYTGGIAFFRWERLPYNNVVWHCFVVAGAAAHFAAVTFFVVPA